MDRGLRRILILILLNSVVFTFGLLMLGQKQTAFDTTYAALRGKYFGDDSWGRMDASIGFLHRDHTKSVYAEMFFDNGNKFIYFPTSLLFLEPVRFFCRGNQIAPILNSLSWGALFVTIALTTIIFITAHRLQRDQSRPENLLEWIAALLIPILLTLTFYPIVKSVTLGQLQTMINLLFAAAVLAWLKNGKGIAGILCGLIALMKPQLSLLILWALLRKEWSFVKGFGAVVVVFLPVSVFLYGLPSHIEYCRVLSVIAQHGETFYPNQSMNGLLNRLFSTGPSLEWSPSHYPAFNPWVYAGTVLTSCLLIAIALFWKFRQRGNVTTAQFFIAVLSFTMASPIAWEHHYGILLPMFAVLLPIALASSKIKPISVGLLAASLILTSHYFPVTNVFAGTGFNVVQSYLYFGALLLLVFLYRSGSRKTDRPYVSSPEASKLIQLG